MRKFRLTAVALMAGLALVAAACGDDDDTTATPAADGTTAPSTDTTAAPAPDTTATPAESGSLVGVCPDPLIIQTDWFPEADHGYSYQAIGVDGVVDATNGTYSGPLGDTGITLEVRAGGPYISFAPPAQQIYADPEIFAGYADTGDVIRNAGGEQPLVSVFANYDKGPQIIQWDPEVYPDVQTIEDIRDTDATVLYFEGAAYMDYFLANGLLNEDQIDASYDGSPTRFVAEGDLFQQGFATAEPFNYENVIEGWQKPVEYLLVHDTGFEIYQSALSVRPDTLTEEADCLEALIPIFQQSLVDYITDPVPMNARLTEIVAELEEFWVITDELNAAAVEVMLEQKLVTDGDNGFIGDFDCARVDALIETLRPVYEGEIPDDLACDAVVTNQFLDDTISLGK